MSNLPFRTALWALGIILFMALAPQNGAFAEPVRAALVIVDMQPHFAERNGRHLLPGNPKKIEAVLNRQRELIRIAKANNVPILLVEYKGKGDTHAKLIAELGNYKFMKIQKPTSGIFANKPTAAELIEFLDGRKIKNLVIAGANGCACVQMAIEGALDNGYHVWTDAGSIIDFESSEFIYPYVYSEESLELLFNENLMNFKQAKPKEIEALLSTPKCDGDLGVPK